MCDGACNYVDGETRILPTGDSSNAIVCRQCYNKEITFRIRENSRRSNEFKFAVPSWESLEIYKPD